MKDHKDHKDHKRLVFNCPLCQAKVGTYEHVIRVRNKADNLLEDLQALISSLTDLAEKIQGR